MTDIIVECKGGVVQEITVLGERARVFVIDWDEEGEGESGAQCSPWTTQRGIESLAPETRARYEQAVRAN